MKPENTINENKAIRKWQKPLFYVVLFVLPLVLLSPSLKKDWALLDDPDMIYSGIRAMDGIFNHLDFSGLHAPANKVGGRFHPGYYVYLGLRSKIIGLNPFANHVFVFFLLYVQLLLMHFFIYRLTGKYIYSLIGIILYLFYSQGEWSTAYYNWYSLIPTEPVLPLLGIFSIILFIKANKKIEQKKVRAWIYLGFSVFLAGCMIFTKEPSLAFAGTAFIILALTRIKKTNAFGWKRSLSVGYFLGCVFLCIVFVILYYALRTKVGATQYPSDYRFAPGYLLHQGMVLWYKLFQNYTFLLPLLILSFFMRSVLCFRGNLVWGKREVIQTIFLSWMVFSCAILLPWHQILERHLLIPVLCFSLFGALEIHALIALLSDKEFFKIAPTPKSFKVLFWSCLFFISLFFIFGKLAFPKKYYAFILKVLVGIWGGVFVWQIARDFLKRVVINHLSFRFVIFLFCLSFFLLLFFGSFGAYNFNHKYEGVEGVLVRMVKTVARKANPGARIYFHLPKGHIYIGQMNYRMPLFEKREDLKSFSFSAEPGTKYKRGDLIVHHPWLSEPEEFPFFPYEGNLEKIKTVKIEHPYIQGANFRELKRWIIANFTFPRDSRVRFLEKKLHHNWWEIYIILSSSFTITKGDQ